MKLSYTDLITGKRKSIKAKITKAHSASSYGQPVIVLQDSGPLDYNSATLLNYRIEQATAAERVLLAERQRWMPPLG